jgi:hypothetical protein
MPTKWFPYFYCAQCRWTGFDCPADQGQCPSCKQPLGIFAISKGPMQPGPGKFVLTPSQRKAGFPPDDLFSRWLVDGIRRQIVLMDATDMMHVLWPYLSGKIKPSQPPRRGRRPGKKDEHAFAEQVEAAVLALLSKGYTPTQKRVAQYVKEGLEEMEQLLGDKSAATLARRPDSISRRIQRLLEARHLTWNAFIAQCGHRR